MVLGTLSRRTKGCEQVAGVFKSFPTNNANIGEEDYAIVSLMRSEDIPFAGWVIETTPDRKEAKAQIMDTYENYIKGKQIYGSLAFWIDENIAEDWKPARNNMRLVEIFMPMKRAATLPCGRFSEERWTPRHGERYVNTWCW